MLSLSSFALLKSLVIRLVAYSLLKVSICDFIHSFLLVLFKEKVTDVVVQILQREISPFLERCANELKYGTCHIRIFPEYSTVQTERLADRKATLQIREDLI